MRVGIGFDAHRFGEGGRMMLGGVEIPGGPGFAAHSDGDIVLHALADAILGALGREDIGILFPDTDEANRGMASDAILARAVALMRGDGWRVGNADLVIVCERPKISPHYPAIRARVAALLGVGPERVGVKAKTMEGMGEIGRGAAASCTAVVALDRT